MKEQIIIPKELRERYGYTKEVELTLTPIDENRILSERVPKPSEIFGFLGKAEASKILLEAREAETPAERERQTELEKTQGI